MFRPIHVAAALRKFLIEDACGDPPPPKRLQAWAWHGPQRRSKLDLERGSDDNLLLYLFREKSTILIIEKTLINHLLYILR
jgi:hypothetical protein